MPQRSRFKTAEKYQAALEQNRKYEDRRREDRERYKQLRETNRCQKCSYRKWWFDVRDNLGFDKCCACGSSKYIQCHHVDDSEKSFTPSDMYTTCPNAERLQLYIDELKKCIPLCQYCHNDLHATSSNKRQARVFAGITRFILENL